MPDVCLYFQVHQPLRLLPFEAIPAADLSHYENEEQNLEILNRVCDQCYLPANAMFLEIVKNNHGRFCFSMSLSGVLIEQLERWRPDVLESFKELVATGCVELLAETYYHSLAFVHSNKEFDRQIDMHLEKVQDVFRVRPRVFRNTELVYNDAIAATAETMGFDGILAEGVDWQLKGKSPNYVYRAPETARIKTLLRNHTLSDDLGFRFSDSKWGGYPLTAEKFSKWLGASQGDVVNLFLDYEVIGEHQKSDTGIFEFWHELPKAMEAQGLQWVTPTDAVHLYRAAREYHCQYLTSWADQERDLSAWLGNDDQQAAIEMIHQLEKDVVALDDAFLTDLWAKFQTSDHYYWMATKQGTDGKIHDYFNPYENPQQAFAIFSNAVAHFKSRVKMLRASSAKAVLAS